MDQHDQRITAQPQHPVAPAIVAFDYPVWDPLPVVVIRGDGAASNPVTMSLAPESQLGRLPEAPPPR